MDTKCLVINTNIKGRFKVLRNNGKRGVLLQVEKDDAGEWNGIIIKSLSETINSHSNIFCHSKSKLAELMCHSQSQHFECTHMAETDHTV
jgi:hypothetical protein